MESKCEIEKIVLNSFGPRILRNSMVSTPLIRKIEQIPQLLLDHFAHDPHTATFLKVITTRISLPDRAVGADREAALNTQGKERKD